MNAAQMLWWKQARSDFQMFQQLDGCQAEPCHRLHFLQMATEKIGKAYLWRAGHPPPKSHLGFVRFLKSLASRSDRDRQAIAIVLGLQRSEDFDRWLVRLRPLAHDLERLAPAEAQDAPNPEYPWPHHEPVTCPCDWNFPIRDTIRDTGRGRSMMRFIETTIVRFDRIA